MWSDVTADVHQALERVGRSGYYILGPEVSMFEEKLAAYSGMSYAVGTGNGLDALEIGLRALGVKPGDRVLTTPLSAFASSLAIVRVGAVPVFADTDDRGLLDLDVCRSAMRAGRVAWLLPVHLYGIAMDLDALGALRDEFGVSILEDCAQAVGARWNGRPVGAVAGVGAISFYPTKNLGAMGDAGAIITDSAEVAGKAKALRNYGESSKYEHVHVGLNSRLDELHAAILKDVFLPRLPDWMEKRRAVAGSYIAGISNDRVRILETSIDRSVWHIFAVAVAPQRRTEFMKFMDASGVSVAVHYPKLISDQDAIRNECRFEVYGSLDKAAQLCASEVSLPMHPYLTSEEVAHIIETVNQWRG